MPDSATAPFARGYGARLLRDLGVRRVAPFGVEVHPALRWAQSGCMTLTGPAHGAARMCPLPLASFADGIIGALAALAPAARLRGLDGAALLGERAALAGLTRAGAISAGGNCRLLPAADGWLAVSLARASDWQLLPAWLEAGPIAGWDALAALLRARRIAPSIERARLVGLAAAPLARAPGAVRWYREICRARAGDAALAARRPAVPRVVDLSALWAGPLCAQLLQLLGARVVKVESGTRPDGLREGSRAFFDLLNAGKASVVLDFDCARDLARLRSLLLSADIVIEASRPRALRQLGIHAEEILERNPAVTWIGISGYGRAEPQGNWIAYGDDAAVAGGLSQALRVGEEAPLFWGDAIADPLTGLHAALAAWSSYTSGGGRLLSLAMRDVIAHCVRCGSLPETAWREGAAWDARPLGAAALRTRELAWQSCITPADIAPPRARTVSAPAGASHQSGCVASAARRPASRPKNVASASDMPEL